MSFLKKEADESESGFFSLPEMKAKSPRHFEDSTTCFHVFF